MCFRPPEVGQPSCFENETLNLKCQGVDTTPVKSLSNMALLGNGSVWRLLRLRANNRDP